MQRMLERQRENKEKQKKEKKFLQDLEEVIRLIVIDTLYEKTEFEDESVREYVTSFPEASLQRFLLRT